MSDRTRFLLPAAVVASLASLPAHAVLDVSDATTYLSGDVTTALTAVGGAVILLAALAMGFRWIKAMFF